MMRVYIPRDWSDLPGLVRDHQVQAPVTAYAVTAQVRDLADTDDAEELEEIARALAADAAVRSGCVRPCVLAVDVPDRGVSDPDVVDVGAVQVTTAVPFSQVAAVLVSDESASVDAESQDDVELLWFLPHEIEGLLADG